MCCFPILCFTGCTRCRRKGVCVCPCLHRHRSSYDDADGVCCCCIENGRCC
jgi:hypothetical protein